MLLIGGFNATHDAHTHVDKPFFNLIRFHVLEGCCLLYTSDAADEL